MDFEQTKQYLNTLSLADALWWFIENTGYEDEHREDLFFYLRERKRSERGKPAAFLDLAEVQSAIHAAHEGAMVGAEDAYEESQSAYPDAAEESLECHNEQVDAWFERCQEIDRLVDSVRARQAAHATFAPIDLVGIRDVLDKLVDEVDNEIEQRKESGNDEYWQGLAKLNFEATKHLRLIIKFLRSHAPYVIYSETAAQDDEDHERLYWSNKDGWVDRGSATVFYPCQDEGHNPIGAEGTETAGSVGVTS
jgi:hypothetical protein